MDHSAEITHDAFRALVSIDAKPEHVTTTEHAQIITYSVHGVLVRQINSFVSQVIQYYVQDINA